MSRKITLNRVPNISRATETLTASVKTALFSGVTRLAVCSVVSRLHPRLCGDPIRTVHMAEASGFQYYMKQGDLFSCPETDALAHCISEDVRMGKGIAVLFKKKFGGVEDLKKQGKKPGQTAVLKRGSRYVYYLVTKVKYSEKPTYDTLKDSLEDMKKHCVKNKVSSLSMPLIGCGLDLLKWDKVEAIVKEVFADTDVKVTVYHFDQGPK